MGYTEIEKQKEEFPIATKGYPISNIININGDNLESSNKNQTLRYKSKIDDEIVIILAQGDVIFERALKNYLFSNHYHVI